jgi:hypothetical protein
MCRARREVRAGSGGLAAAVEVVAAVASSVTEAQVAMVDGSVVVLAWPNPSLERSRDR